MSDVRTCPTCGAKAKFRLKEEKENYTAIQDEDVFKKIKQMKAMMEKYKSRAEKLEQELAELKK